LLAEGTAGPSIAAPQLIFVFAIVRGGTQALLAIKTIESKNVRINFA
jgi:hypothetical protein